MTGADVATTGFRRSETMAVLAIGIISGFVPALQPLLLGQLAAEARIDLAQIGQAAMLEALGMALSVSLAGALLRPVRLRLITLAAIVAPLLINLLTPHLSGGAILAARFVGGLGAGMLLWLWMGMLTRVAVPARLIAMYVTIQAATVLGLSAVFSTILLPWGGGMAGYGAVAVFYLILLPLVLFVPGAYAALPRAEGLSLPSGRGLVGLLAVLVHLAAIMALWVYVVPLGAAVGLSQETAGIAISVALAAQIVAGFLAGVVAPRVYAPGMLLLCVIASIAGIFLLATATSSLMFIAGVAIVGFFWMFAPPFQMPYLIQIDPSRRAAMQMATAQLIGVAAGPALASVAVTAGGISQAWIVSMGMYAFAGMLIAATLACRRTPVPG